MTYSIVIAALVSYLLGNLNGAVCVSALMHDDVRSHGSGNAGLTNFIRNYGIGRALYVILIDAGKAYLACLASGLLLKPFDMESAGMAIGGVAVMLGHDFPALLGFRGGKLRIAHCQNEAAALELKARIESVFPQTDVTIQPCRGLCSYYAEKGGLLVGFEKN